MDNQIDSLLKEISEYPYVDDFEKKIQLVEAQTNLIFLKMKLCETVEAADIYFRILDSIQITLARLMFKEYIEVSDGVRTFVHDFDRLDDYKTKVDLLAKIKVDKYLFNYSQ